MWIRWTRISDPHHCLKIRYVYSRYRTHLMKMILVPVCEPDAQLVHIGPVALLADDGLAGERAVLVHQQLRVLAQMAGGA